VGFDFESLTAVFTLIQNGGIRHLRALRPTGLEAGGSGLAHLLRGSVKFNIANLH